MIDLNIIYNYSFIISMKSQSYSLQDIEAVWIQLTNGKAAQTNSFKDQLNLISRMLIWDDQNQSDIFDFVCQVKMFDTLIQIFSKSKDKEVINSSIGFFTMLLTNLTKQPSVNYLLSHPCIASLQLTKFGNMNNQVADYYVNFLKVLSRKVSTNNLQLFFNKRNPCFPLLTQSARFFNHPQSLVRTTCRNVLLTIAKLKQPIIDEFMSGFPFVSYYINECNFLKQYWLIIDGILHSQQDNRYQLDNLDMLVQDQQEVLIFLDDLLGLGQKGVAEKFGDAFINQCLSPLAIALDSEIHEGFSIKLVLFVLSILFKSISNTFILDMMAIVVVGKYYTKNISECLFQPIDRLLSYDKKWKFKGFWDSHEDKLNHYCLQTYFSEKKSQSSQYTIMDSISKKIDTFSVFGVTNNFYERQIQKIQQIFGIPIISSPEDLERYNGSKAIKQVLTAINTQGLDLSQCEINPISQAIQSYLISKDDSLMMLTLNFLSSFITNRGISESVKNFCKLSLKPKASDFESIIRIQKIIINCIKVYQVDPPCYRICTYVQAQQLTKKLLTLYEVPDLKLSTDIVNSLKQSMKVAIDRINPYLYGGKQWERSLKILQEVTSNLSKRRAKSLKTYGLIPCEDIPDQSQTTLTNSVYQQFPRQFPQQIARDFWIYLLIRDLFVFINTKFLSIKIDMPKKEVQNQKYDAGKTYWEIQQQTIFAQYKTSVMDKYAFCELILMSGYFAIVKNHKIELKASYQDLIMMPDKSDPRKLLLKLEEGYLWIGLKDTKMAMDLKKHFQESNSVMLRYKLSQMVKQTQLLLGLC